MTHLFALIFKAIQGDRKVSVWLFITVLMLFLLQHAVFAGCAYFSAQLQGWGLFGFLNYLPISPEARSQSLNPVLSRRCLCLVILQQMIHSAMGSCSNRACPSDSETAPTLSSQEMKAESLAVLHSR